MNRQEAIDNIAGISTYIQSDFSTGIGQGMAAAGQALTSVLGSETTKNMFQSFGQKVIEATKTTNKFGTDTVNTAKKVNTAVDNSGKNLVNTAKTSSTTAKTSIETEVGSADPKPTVKKVEVPSEVKIEGFSAEEVEKIT